jgi:hypothetical protein
MPLPFDICRCLGVSRLLGVCAHRDECARFVDLRTGNEATPFAECLCELPRGKGFIPIKTEAAQAV